ncbi:MAG: hypothetical protein U0798_15030 [Gemmataceae bacterium]
MLKLHPLEPRETPSLYAHDGFVILPSGAFYRPFGDFAAANDTAGHGDTYAVGAAAGGGPRVQIVRSATNTDPPERLADFFAFEPSFTGGVNVSTDSSFVAVGAGVGGGPVVAVYDTSGRELSRFFAFESSFRGGVEVLIHEGVIYATAGPGGGPVVATFDLHGTPLGAFFGAPSELRSGFNVLITDAVFGGESITLAAPDGTLYVSPLDADHRPVGQYETHLPEGFTLAGAEGNAVTFGGYGYLTGYGVDLGFRSISPLSHFDDHAAGNPNPPPTTGFRPGTYVIGNSSSGSTDPEDPGEIKFPLLSGESVGATGTGTGTLWAPMVDESGQRYAVTASHVTDLDTYPLIAPGPLDGPLAIEYGIPTRFTNYRSGSYTVDAAAVPTDEPLTSAIQFRGEHYPIEGVRAPVEGETLIAVGRGVQVGVGVYQGPQVEPVHVENGYAGGAELNGQYVVGPSEFGPLSIPGFSGGPVFSTTFDEFGIHRWLVGMTVAGNRQTTFVTPVPAIEDALGLTVVIDRAP